MDGFLNGAPLSRNLLGLAQYVAVDDRENRPTEKDFEDRREAGYPTMHVPKEPGVKRLIPAEVRKQRRRPAHHAPVVVFEVDMHLYWTGVATDRWCTSNRSLESSA